MLSEKETMGKLEESARLFDHYFARKEYGKAHNIYNMAHTVAVYMELGEDALKKLFGDWDSDDGYGHAEDKGLFQGWKVDMVNQMCCIRQHMSYEDAACRMIGKPMKYYSEDDYCARCEERKKRAARR